MNADIIILAYHLCHGSVIPNYTSAKHYSWPVSHREKQGTHSCGAARARQIPPSAAPGRAVLGPWESALCRQRFNAGRSTLGMILQLGGVQAKDLREAATSQRIQDVATAKQATCKLPVAD
ncbi:hypothetical protein PsYK624_088440 [Phanerochaete sordida]|uniref:Uncharacterized protein n=1 Tax=Phanerochaete sordida TaxID=48140 RepID=A0A9P3GFC4_9APHY|nr:hypothetical protein PsYK624_088440 [Phanerochaete sordida]